MKMANKKNITNGSPPTLSPEEIQRLLDTVEALQEALKAKTAPPSPPPPPRRDPMVTSNSIACHRPSKYEGQPSPMTLDRWKRELETIFEVVRYPKAWKVDQAALYLDGPTRIWW